MQQALEYANTLNILLRFLKTETVLSFTIEPCCPAGDQVLNIRAAGFGHSDVFSVDKRVGNGLTCLAKLLSKVLEVVPDAAGQLFRT